MNRSDLLMERKNEQCPVIYDGPSYPWFSGERCTIDHHPHPGVRHRGGQEHGRLLWWTKEEKEKMK